MSLELATKFATAVRERDLGDAVDLLTEKAVMDTPMLGTITGRLKIRGTLSMITKMGGGNMKDPEEKNGAIFSTAAGPRGNMLIVFEFDDDKISKLDISRL